MYTNEWTAGLTRKKTYKMYDADAHHCYPLGNGGGAEQNKQGC